MNHDEQPILNDDQIQQLDTAMREYFELDAALREHFELERRGNELLSQSIQETQALIANAIRILTR